MDFDYSIIRTKRKTVGLQVDRNGSVTVRVPLKMSKKAVLDAVEKNKCWIVRNIEKQMLREDIMPDAATLDETEIKRLRAMAKEILPQKVEYFSAVMGLKPTSIKITSAKTRFGSCSGKNGICFSLFLMRYPEPAIDYVVVHELAHIRHHNHSAAFYRLIEQYMPDYKQRKQLLK